MNRLLLLGPMLAWTSAAGAQLPGAEESAQCSATAQGAPFIERIDAVTAERPTETTAIIQLDVVASLPDGRALTYAFSGVDGTITSQGSRGTWLVAGAGPFTATIEVSAPGYPCVSYASVNYTLPPAFEEAGDDPGEEPGEEPTEE